MSKMLHKDPWYSDYNPVIRKVDDWVSRRRLQTNVGYESDWLGWDGWVRTESGPAGGTAIRHEEMRD